MQKDYWIEQREIFPNKQRKDSTNGVETTGQPSGNKLKLDPYFISRQKINSRDFPGGTVVKNPPAIAGDTGSSPGPGKIPQAAEQLSPCATTTEPALQCPRAATTEACVPRACAPQEKPPQ